MGRRGLRNDITIFEPGLDGLNAGLFITERLSIDKPKTSSMLLSVKYVVYNQWSEIRGSSGSCF